MPVIVAYHITFAQGRIFIVTARPRGDELNDQAVRRLRELAAQTKAEVPGVNVGITGEPVLEFDEMAQSQHDTTVATIVSLALVALIFIYGYNESGRPIKATICLIVGLAYTMAFATLGAAEVLRVHPSHADARLLVLDAVETIGRPAVRGTWPWPAPTSC